MRSRLLMDEVHRDLAAQWMAGQPALVGFIENVVECRRWDQWNRWLNEFHLLGYKTKVLPRSFPDRQKRKAEDWLNNIEADMSRGQYLDPRAGRTTFGQYATKWLASQSTDISTRASVEPQIRLHAIPYLGSRPMDSFQPAHIRGWLSDLEQVLPASSYRRFIFASVKGIFTAAMEDGLLAKNPCTARSVTEPPLGVGRVQPWTTARVFAMKRALPRRYRAMVDVGGGGGLRQGGDLRPGDRCR